MNRAESALAFISPVERETWVSMAMALRSEHGDTALDVWLDWSRQADSFRESDAMAVWRSCRGAGVTIGSLFHLAKQNGWRDNDTFPKPTAAQIQAQQAASAERATQHGQERIKAQKQAANKAGWILHQCKPERHAYLQSKGWPEMDGLVWRPDENQNLLCIPMRIHGALVGLQMIDRHGSKKFLTGQRTGGAEYVIANKGPNILCEGYATGLSIHAAMSALKARYTIHICFSAGNLVKVAETLEPGLIVADNDASLTGQKAAEQTGWPYWLPPTAGQDYNDLHRSLGTFRAAQLLRKALIENT